MVGQKASTYNDGYVNFPKRVYELCLEYIHEFRPDSTSELVFLWPNNLRPVSSQDLGRICGSVFREIVRKDFVFTDYRQYLQSVFAQTCKDPQEKQWFNRVMQHRYILL